MPLLIDNVRFVFNAHSAKDVKGVKYIKKTGTVETENEEVGFINEILFLNKIVLIQQGGLYLLDILCIDTTTFIVTSFFNNYSC